MVLRSLMRIQVLLFLLTAGLLVVLSTSEARALGTGAGGGAGGSSVGGGPASGGGGATSGGGGGGAAANLTIGTTANAFTVNAATLTLSTTTTTITNALTSVSP